MTSLSDLGVGMLVIDHLSQVLGDADENTAQVAGVMSALRGMAEALNLALVLIHHQVKSVAARGISSSDSLRGHGSILASCDLACVVERHTLDPLGINIRPVAVRGPGLEQFAAKFSYDQKTDGSLELNTARFWGFCLENVSEEIEQAILDTLRENSEPNQTKLRGLVSKKVPGATDQSIREIIARMEQSKAILWEKAKQNAKIYRLGGGNSG
jgi:hypothetical protein